MSETATTYELEEARKERAVQPITPMTLLQSAQNTNASIEQMQQLMELQIRWEQNEARKAYNEAIAAFKSENVHIYKDSVVDFKTSKGRTSYSHANLASIVSAVTPILSKYGLSHSWDTQQDGNTVQVTCKISHRLGHSEKVSLYAQPDNSGTKNNIQAIGSTVTYLQRYTLVSALGLAAHDQDDDGRMGQQAPTNNAPANDGTLSDERFQQLKPAWEKIIKSKAKSVQDIINAAKGKGIVMTNEQVQQLERIK